MAVWLTDAWFEAVVARGGQCPPAPGVSARVQVALIGGPDGDVDVQFVVDDGRVVAGGLGRVADPDVTGTVPFADAEALVRGDLDLPTAFMQGRVKLAGDMKVALEVLVWSSTDAARALITDVAAASEF